MNFLIFWGMALSSPELKKLLYFFPKNFSYHFSRTSQSRKTKISCVFLILWDGSFQHQAFKISYIFLKYYFVFNFLHQSHQKKFLCHP